MLQLTTIFFLISFSILAVLHIIANQLFLYWHLPWLDIPMHLFGGAVVALGVYTMRDLRFIAPRVVQLWSVVAIVLVVAIIWEVFELLAGVPIRDDFVLDTSIDLVMGLAGAFIGYFIGKSLRSLR